MALHHRHHHPSADTPIPPQPPPTHTHARSKPHLYNTQHINFVPLKLDSFRIKIKIINSCFLLLTFAKSKPLRKSWIFREHFLFIHLFINFFAGLDEHQHFRSTACCFVGVSSTRFKCFLLAIREIIITAGVPISSCTAARCLVRRGLISLRRLHEYFY